ncbi:MAG: UDP-4-amino-4,6-dideoxy-N-acetyl-beta-L-altrosamine N-acetyltransferase [Hydrogenobacter thermophilus]|uniref:UDP-4-amino-4, 6-dideoxy-N-acetyl-beta-L-altrosamine N-acetyltransferase n=1 Tax=Hydrogenobacter thermophilus TaxID=940 RepID=UPI001C75F794|nr:UDP-4-amino-4,6-dideoxy-N-acetyl-beta-L-altrosamine N-acetyltransferase [Hydrogenobacter thermophilus]QWK19042.1 MAG: UDP-4-amino-4,6-dideoxy-N-acetyl-beta-L-altrosamine N-acetyltransferase [Hydrogenobacter thermophilus]
MESIRILKENLRIGNITLRNFINLNPDELELVRTWRNHPEVRKWMYNDQEISKEEHFRFVERLKEDSKNFYYLAVKDNAYMGVVNLVRADLRNRNAYFGIYANPENRIQGTGFILGKALLKLAFEIALLHTLRLEVLENNIKALNLYRKLGFKEEGILREFVLKEGKWFDVIVMGMTEEEYRNAHGEN